MANISAIKLPNGTTYNLVDNTSGYTKNTGTITSIKTTAGVHTAINVTSGAAAFNVPTKTSHLTNDSGFITNAGVTGVKGNSESTYRTGQVNLTAANIGAVARNEVGNTQMLKRPSYLAGVNDVTLQGTVNTLRANRLAFLPADQIIIEKTTDGGSTWVDAGIADGSKVQLFSEVRSSIYLPLLNGKKSPLCGLRITITGMKYNVPAGTTETNKYNYWNSNYVLSTERYCQLKELYFWVSTSGGYINVKVERATGKNPNSWTVIFNDTNFNMTGYDGNDYLSFSQGVFGGGTTQTSNYWNYRITLMTDDYIPNSPYDGYGQWIGEIRGYGDTVWTKPDNYMANDHLYSFDYQKNATFPAQVSATQLKSSGMVEITNVGTGANDWASRLLNPSLIFKATDGQAAGLVYTQYDSVKSPDSITVVGNNTGTYFIAPNIQATGSFYGTLNGNATSASSVAWSGITSKPTTLSGYGITDAYTKTEVNGLVSGVLHYKGTKATVADVAAVTSKSTGDVWHVTADGSEWAYDGNAWQELGTAIDLSNYVTHGNTGSATTGITATTTATKTTLGTATSITGVSGSTTASKASGSNGSASNWVFEDVACDDITAWSAGSGSASLTFTMDTTDTKKLKISFSHSHTAPSLTYSAKTASHVKSGGNGTAPSWSFTDVTVPKAAASATSVPNVSVTSATVTITDNGHTHTI